MTNSMKVMSQRAEKSPVQMPSTTMRAVGTKLVEQKIVATKSLPEKMKGKATDGLKP